LRDDATGLLGLEARESSQKDSTPRSYVTSPIPARP
jgi:hypothetical protein